MRDVAGMNRVQRRVGDLLGYLERNQGVLVPYAALAVPFGVVSRFRRRSWRARSMRSWPSA